MVSNVRAESHETRSLVNYRYSSHFLRNIRTRRVLVLTRALTAATSFRSKLLPILLRHLVTNLLGPRLVAKAVSTIRVRLHVNPDVNRGGRAQLLPRQSHRFTSYPPQHCHSEYVFRTSLPSKRL